MLYIFFGQNDFSLREKLEELEQELGDRESLAINTTLFDARHLSPNQLLNACNSAPFLGQKRLVIVEGLLSRFERKSGTESVHYITTKPDPDGEWQILGEYASKMPATTVLVLVDGKVTSDNPLLKRLAPKAIVKTFPPLKGASLHRWIHSRVVQRGGNISPQATKLLAEFGGENLWVLSGEIEKLLVYTSGRCIDKEDVEQVTSYAREANVFAMVDAISERRSPRAGQQLHQLLQEGVAPPFLLAMLTRQFRMIIQAKELRDVKLSPEEIRERLNLSPNYPIDKLLNQASHLSWEQLTPSYHRLLETDIAIKTGKWRDDLALDLLVAELC